MSEFEPKIVAFLCNWCTYVAADAAGVSRLVQKPNVRVIRVNCSGMVDPSYIVKAFVSGADGVLVGGCWPGDCHYVAGNIKTMRRAPLLRKLLGELGVEEMRFRLKWIAASEPSQFAKTVNEMTEELRKLGPFKRKKKIAKRSVA